MAQTILITRSDINDYRAITQNINDVDDLHPYIAEAQEFDIKPLLDCSDQEFLADILANPSSYTDLIPKIKPVLVYYSYARFLANHGVFVTPSGIRRKNSEDSEPVDEATLARLIKQAESSAIHYQKILIDHLEDNLTSYPLWKCSSSSGRRRSGARVRAIGGSSSSQTNCNESWTNFESL